MAKPIAVMLSDVHYDLSTLKLADAATRMAIAKANELEIPLIVAGDLHNTKANLRGECVNAMIETFNLLQTGCFILRGNHDAINEKSQENALSFLNRKEYIDEYTNGGYTPYRNVVNKARFTNDISILGMSLQLIPYHHDTNELKKYLKRIDRGSTVIMHQGIQGSNMGDYAQDKTAITKEDVTGLRVISGHYHARQTIRLPNDGVWDYIGNPFSLSFGEANDPPKGFQILNSDGSLTFVPTNLRKHVVIEMDKDFYSPNLLLAEKNDLIWVKYKGTVSRQKIAEMIGRDDFKLTLLPTDVPNPGNYQPKLGSQSELLDAIIDNLSTEAETKDRLKKTWKGLV